MNVGRLRDGFRVEASIGLGLGSGSVLVGRVRVFGRVTGS